MLRWEEEVVVAVVMEMGEGAQTTGVMERREENVEREKDCLRMVV